MTLSNYLFAPLERKFSLSVLFGHVTLWCVLLGIHTARGHLANIYFGWPRLLAVIFIVEFVCQLVSTRWRMLILILLVQIALTVWSIIWFLQVSVGEYAYIGLTWIAQESFGLLQLLGHDGDILMVLGTRHIGNLNCAIVIAGWWWLVLAVFSWHRSPRSVMPFSPSDKRLYNDATCWFIVAFVAIASALLWWAVEACFQEDDVIIFQFLIIQPPVLSVLYTSALYGATATR